MKKEKTLNTDEGWCWNGYHLDGGDERGTLERRDRSS